jgi:hypothetical protein
MAVTVILISSSASWWSGVNLCWGTTSASTRSSNHNIVSSSSCSTIPSFALNSASDLARDASRKLAATLVPDRNVCLPITYPVWLLGKLPHKRITRSANCFVRSRSPSIRMAHPPAFSFQLSTFRSITIPPSRAPRVHRALLPGYRSRFAGSSSPRWRTCSRPSRGGESSCWAGRSRRGASSRRGG